MTLPLMCFISQEQQTEGLSGIIEYLRVNMTSIVFTGSENNNGSNRDLSEMALTDAVGLFAEYVKRFGHINDSENLTINEFIAEVLL